MKQSALTVMKQPEPIVALDKRTLTGHRVVVTLRPEVGTVWGYWMEAVVDGKLVYERYTAPVRRNACDVPGQPHLLSVGWKTAVSLTNEEADGMDAAKKEWTERVKRAALEARPRARMRVLPEYSTLDVPAGMIVEDEGRPVMSLGVAARRWTDDGWSHGIAAEDGHLYDIRVRELTPPERADYEAEQASARG
ncbi:hypothetical protein [Kitasatospora sp. NPDC098663]|uniref:hypothetical protein n=1 Tax=Kitasatospora sp. NPDC098663 TaxID=3364096 RepID=UPI003830A4B3